MTFRQRLFGGLLMTLIGFGLVGAIVSSYLPAPIEGSDRSVANTQTFLILYLGLWLLITGGVILLGYVFQHSRQRVVSAASHVTIFRIGALVGMGAVALLALRGLDVLTWWDGVLLVIALVLVELSFRTKTTG